MGVTMTTKQKVTIIVIEFAIAAMLFAGSGAIIALKATGNLHVWEDGSWAVGQYPYPISGCIPDQPCDTVRGFAVCAAWADSHGFDTQYLTDHNFPVADCDGIVEFGE